jgi:protocatechuate 3,4-dioxygenase beta subunit
MLAIATVVDRRGKPDEGRLFKDTAMPKIHASLMASLALLLVASFAATAFAQPDAAPQGGKPAPTATAEPVTVKGRTSKPRTADEDGASTLKGIVRDASGKLAANATVWLVVRRDQVFDPPVKMQADANARFSFAEFDEPKLLARGSSVTVMARDAAGRIGWQQLTRSNREQPLCEIGLREVTLLTGRVLDTAGRPLAGARLTPQSFTAPRPEGAGYVGNESISLWPELAAEYSALTTADGVFEIAGVPRDVQARCELAAEAEKVEVTIESGIAATVRLGKAGSIAGRLTPPEGAELPVKGLQLQAQLQVDANRPEEPPLQFNALAEADEKGRFSFAGLPPGRYVIRPVDAQNVPFVVATTPPLEVKSGELLDEVTLPLTPCREVRGRVVDGKTGQGVESVALSLYISEDAAGRHFQGVLTDAEGRFSAWMPPGKVSVRIVRVPVEYLLPYEQVSGENLTGAIRQRDFGETPLIELEPAATIEGIVVDEAGNPVPSAWLDIQTAPIPRVGSWQNPPVRADEAGRFVVRQLEPSEPLVLRARSSTAASEAAITVVPDKVDSPVRLVVSEKHACWFSGQVVDRLGNPLPAARVVITGTRQIDTSGRAGFAGTGRFLRQLRSLVSVPQVAADGRFETEAMYAGDFYQLQVTAPGYGDHLGESIRGEPGKLYDSGPLVLDAFVAFTGLVVDAAGKPVPNAELRVAMPDGSPQVGKPLIDLHSDDTGAFALPPANLAGVLRIWARAGGMTSDGPASFFPDLVNGPLKIELAQANGWRITGKVVDPQGRPVPASVELIWDVERSSRTRFVPNRGPATRRFGYTAGPVSLGASQVTDDGDFTSDGLWAGEHYHLVVTAVGYDTMESAVVSGGRGTTVDAGRLVMHRNNLMVEGEVVDAGSQPIAGATVSNSGDAQKPLSVETDAAGRFRVEGLLEGPAYFLVRKPGYWPAGLRCTSGAVDQRVQLNDEQEPRPKRSLAAVDDRPPRDRRALALRLLTELWDIREKFEPRNSSSRGNVSALGGDIVRHAASIDYRLALKWSAVEGGAFDDVVRMRAFGQIVHDDVDLAIAQAGAPGGTNRLKWMARRRLAAGNRDAALRLLEAALHGNLQTETGYSETHADLRSQAEIGALALAAGRDEWGRQLVNEAADRVEKLGGDADGVTRAVVAAALASYDSPRSLRVWEMLPEPQSGISAEIPRGLAVLVGMHDLKAARRIAKRAPQQQPGGGRIRRPMQPGNSQAADFDPILVNIAGRLSGTHPEKALLLLEEIGESQQLEKAEVVGRIALALAPRNAPLAFKLIDQALDLCFTAPPTTRSSIPTNRAQTAARIAAMAAEAGYPDMQVVVDQVLAMRLTPAEVVSAPLRSAATIETAWLLAMIDPAVARTILSVMPPAPDPGARSYDDARKVAQWLQAWVLVDVEHAVDLFHELLKEQGRSLSSESVSYGLLPMIDSLLWSHDDRLSLVLPQNGPSWFPGTTD